MRCIQCGNENPATNRFCGQCGSSLSELRAAEPVRQGAFNAASDVQSIPASDAAPVFKQTALGSNQPDAVESQWFSEGPVSKASRVQITGPSFLGLGEPSTEEETDVTYLYEEESSGGHARFWIAAVMTVALIAFVAYEWYRNPSLSRRIEDRISQIWDVNKVKSPPPSVAMAPTGTDTQAVAPAIPKKDTEPTTTETSAVNQPKVPEASAASGSSAKAGVSGLNEATSDADSTEETAPSRAAENPQPDLRRGTKRTSSETGSAERRADTHAAALAQADNYLYGRGVVKSCGQALDYLRKAADQGSAGARSKLGGLYATGNCVPLDRVRAYYWFNLARSSGDHNAWVDQNMSMLWSAMTPQEKTRAMQPR